MPHTLAELDAIRDDCRRMVTRRAAMSAGAAVVPVPGADLIADVGILRTMLPAISERFGLREDQVETMDATRAQQVLAIAAGMGNNVIGRAVTKRVVIALLRRMGVRVATASAARYVPLIGSAVAATINFGAMKLAGNAHIEDCYATAKTLASLDSPPAKAIEGARA
ncbi:uncharacterized protein (DUF697 family) [Sphingomonas insulae]|uniref:DUF697 domain-containing protein n=1 Tax=Sphingomonas insulae TaxID=424800 RepID=A0ABP3T4A3_9SPHN|nr:hypothetical protein [Sphingomonas insulae]NIJ28821.1 uncharacterized protein (DUF697 family) [Sphingomonas insulae]